MPRSAKSNKGLIRSLSRRGTRSDKSPVVAQKTRFREPTVCERCGAIFTHRTWRKRILTQALLARAAWGVCPACTQMRAGEYCGRILVRGAYAVANEAAIRRRIQQVDQRARVTQPERRVVSIERAGDVLEILTTSQKLAHRIVHELRKAFGGRASYSWADRDGTLFATWQRADVP